MLIDIFYYYFLEVKKNYNKKNKDSVSFFLKENT